MAAGDPVCNVNQRIPRPNPSIPLVPPIPRATDLPSALRAIQALTQAIQILSNQHPPTQFNQGDVIINNVGGGGGTRRSNPNSNGDFVEIRERRETSDQRIYDPNDREVYVDVKRIDSLTFFDKVSRHFVKWTR